MHRENIVSVLQKPTGCCCCFQRGRGGMYCTYDVTLRCVRTTIVAMQQQWVLNI